jgi:hypothetical protein
MRHAQRTHGSLFAFAVAATLGNSLVACSGSASITTGSSPSHEDVPSPVGDAGHEAADAGKTPEVPSTPIGTTDDPTGSLPPPPPPPRPTVDVPLDTLVTDRSSVHCDTGTGWFDIKGIFDADHFQFTACQFRLRPAPGVGPLRVTLESAAKGWTLDSAAFGADGQIAVAVSVPAARSGFAAVFHSTPWATEPLVLAVEDDDGHDGARRAMLRLEPADAAMTITFGQPEFRSFFPGSREEPSTMRRGADGRIVFRLGEAFSVATPYSLGLALIEAGPVENIYGDMWIRLDTGLPFQRCIFGNFLDDRPSTPNSWSKTSFHFLGYEFGAPWKGNLALSFYPQTESRPQGAPMCDQSERRANAPVDSLRGTIFFSSWMGSVRREAPFDIRLVSESLETDISMKLPAGPNEAQVLSLHNRADYPLISSTVSFGIGCIEAAAPNAKPSYHSSVFGFRKSADLSRPAIEAGGTLELPLVDIAKKAYANDKAPKCSGVLAITGVLLREADYVTAGVMNWSPESPFVLQKP